MNWKDVSNERYVRYVAWASRAVGGKYEIQRYQTQRYRPSDEAPWRFDWRFDIRYLYRTGPGAWNDPGIGKTAATLEEAKALAEAHHKQQLERSKETER